VIEGKSVEVKRSVREGLRGGKCREVVKNMCAYVSIIMIIIMSMSICDIWCDCMRLGDSVYLCWVKIFVSEGNAKSSESVWKCV
jgi:hypothetical protein